MRGLGSSLLAVAIAATLVSAPTAQAGVKDQIGAVVSAIANTKVIQKTIEFVSTEPGKSVAKLAGAAGSAGAAYGGYIMATGYAAAYSAAAGGALSTASLLAGAGLVGGGLIALAGIGAAGYLAVQGGKGLYGYFTSPAEAPGVRGPRMRHLDLDHLDDALRFDRSRLTEGAAGVGTRH